MRCSDEEGEGEASLPAVTSSAARDDRDERVCGGWETCRTLAVTLALKICSRQSGAESADFAATSFVFHQQLLFAFYFYFLTHVET